MPTIQVTVTSPLPPDRVISRLTDFTPARTEAWAGVDAGGLTVHDQGPDWAEVTEGNKVGWERQRYSWDVAAGTVSATTLESNIWRPGSSGWDYQVVPEGSGSRVTVTARRDGYGLKGKLVQGLLAVIGKKMITDSTTKVLSS